MAAFTASALPLFFCGLLIIEAARWHMTRQMLNLALLEAARAGTTAHARPAAIEQAFEAALLPLFHPPGRHGDARTRMRASFLYVAQQTGAAPWRIEVLAPTAEAYADFGDASLRVPGAPGLPAIRNDYQAEQHLRRRRMGWQAGRGPRSGQTVFEANMLRLRLAYAHPPWLPGLRALLARLAAGRGSRDPAARAGMLVMEMEMALPMQSHPVLWHRIAAGGASRPWRSEGVGRPAAPGAGAGDRLQVLPPWRGEESAAVSGQPDPGAQGASRNADHRRSDDPACGVLICCVDR
ncbi:Flp pilus-assembly TadG-like N-terminal domain-containing protein [Bordetella sputigena]